VTVVSDSSTLVILTKVDCFDLLNRLFPHPYISAEVHHEVVVSGAGLAGALEVAKAEWFEVKKLQNQKDLSAARENMLWVLES
jgi:predicted nucleic acid-binding protein